MGPDGSPVAGARVALVSLPGIDWEPPRPPEFRKTDEVGRFALDRVPLGRIPLTLRTAEGLEAMAWAEGSVTEVRFDLAPAGHVVGQVALEPAPHGRSWTSVELDPPGLEWPGGSAPAGVIGPEGRFGCRLAEGTYRLRVRATPDWNGLAKRFTVRAGEVTDLGTLRPDAPD